MISSELDLLLNTCTVALNASLFSDLEDKDGILNTVTHVMTAAGVFFTLVFVFCKVICQDWVVSRDIPLCTKPQEESLECECLDVAPSCGVHFSEVRQQYEEVIRKILHLGFCSETAFFFSLEKNLTWFSPWRRSASKSLTVTQFLKATWHWLRYVHPKWTHKKKSQETMPRTDKGSPFHQIWVFVKEYGKQAQFACYKTLNPNCLSLNQSRNLSIRLTKRRDDAKTCLWSEIKIVIRMISCNNSYRFGNQMFL